MKTKPLSRMTAAALVAASLFAAAAPAQAFRLIHNNTTGRITSGSAVACSYFGGFAHWDIRNIDWYHNTAGQGSGKAAALQAALDAWTDVPAANHVLSYAGTTTAGFSTDGRNTIVWASGNGCTGTCLAITALVLQAGQEIVESDISFNDDFTWETDGSDQDTQAVAAHELGHSLGIHHTELTTTPRPTMFTFYFGMGGRTLHADDESALQCSEGRY